MISNFLGECIYEHRKALEMTQDQFGAKYEVSGPAVFKFEKGYVKPSLRLWLVMAKDCKIPESKAVLLWVKSRLPQKYQDLIDLKSGTIVEEPVSPRCKQEGIDYKQYKNRNAILQAALKDLKMPRGLKAMLREDDIWNLYKPTGAELNFLRDTFGKLGKGTKEKFREALRLVRDFTGAD